MLEHLDLAARNTPLQPLDRLAGALDLPAGRLWVKRDDLTGLTAGGNKARKLEFLVADALARGCDTLITAGAAQSNHVRATAAAAAMHGLDCIAVMPTLGRAHDPEGNLVLDDLFDVRIVWTAPETHEAMMERVRSELAESGKQPYVIPLGGTNALGAVGYVIAAEEIEAQLPGATVMCAVGTGGTLAGLTVGLGNYDRVLGFDIGAVPDLPSRLPQVTSQTAALLGRSEPTGRLRLDASQAEHPYGAPTRAAREAIRLVARTSGLALDPVYTGRAMAGVIQKARVGELPDTPLVLMHTGGLPALFTRRYRDWFQVPPELDAVLESHGSHEPDRPSA